MSVSIPAPLRRLLLSAGFVPALAVAVPEASSSAELSPYAVTATRTPAAVTTLGTNVDVITAEEIARRQLRSIGDALAGAAGAPVFATGAPGAMASLFLRGANSTQTLFLVDGIRFNDPNTDYNFWLSGATLGCCDNLEIAHGPQSTLYGSEAVGGVVSLSSRRGHGPAQQSVSVEAGSYGTVQGSVSAQGGDERTGYSFTAAGGHTDNDRPNNDFDSASYVLRLDRTVNDTVSVGATWRGFNGVYGSPGAAVGYGANDPDNEERESNQLATLFADFKHSATLTSRATLGAQFRRYVAESPSSYGTDLTVIKNRRAVLDWQTSWQATSAQRLTAGFTGERNHTRNTGFGDIDRSQRLYACFVQDEFTPLENVYLTAGLRRDDFDTFGQATTGKATAAWLVAGNRLKLRTSYGTAFRSPSFLDLYGKSSYYAGNPALAPEKGRGWDAGLDYYLPDNRGTLSATWFHTRTENLIVYDYAAYPMTVRNVDDALMRGLELAAQVRLPGDLTARLSYTELAAENLTSHTRLLRRPRHSGTLDLWRSFGPFSLGAAVQVVADRQDVDAETYLTIDAEDYTVVRVYGAWQLNRQLTLKARLENALDEQYAQVNGYPQPGVGAYAGLEWKF